LLTSYPQSSIAVVANDAGAARLMASWLKPIDKQLIFCLTGPAYNIFKQQRKVIINNSLHECLFSSKLLISGSGWASNIEHNSRLMASELGIRSIAVLDHWINYNKRFELNGIVRHPDEIWVGDDEAESIANIQFPMIKVIKLENKWINELKSSVEQARKVLRKEEYLFTKGKPARNLLFLLEPLRDHSTGKPNHNEFKALDYMLESLALLAKKKFIAPLDEIDSIRLRPHPSEKTDKYDNWIKKYRHLWPLKHDAEVSLERSLALADATFGCETQALVAALECNIPAFSCMPAEIGKCRLPHKDIKHIINLE